MTDQPEQVSEALRECPFCEKNGSHIRMQGGDAPKTHPLFWLRCLRCECEGPPESSEEKAIAAWNRRAVATPDVVEAARAIKDASDAFDLDPPENGEEYEDWCARRWLLLARAALASPPAEAREKGDKP